MNRVCGNCFNEFENQNNPICPNCGYNSFSDSNNYPMALPIGTVVGGKYIVGRVLGQGGFGITYLAKDYTNGCLVALKEFFPDSLVTRNNSIYISCFTGERQENFVYGKKCFLQEAQTLSAFRGNKNIVDIFNYFEENGTAYFAMEYIDGISLKNYLKQNGGRLSWEECKRILFPIMDALSVVHSKGIIHRDISPDNIIITKDNNVKLLDFGAARYSIGDKSRSLDVVLKHGYAPKEQYTRRGKQGPYTDVYSLGATFYVALTGNIPSDSVDRIEYDDLVDPKKLGVNLPDSANYAIVKALSINQSDRFQDIKSFKQALTYQPKEYKIPKIINTQNQQNNNQEHFENTNNRNAGLSDIKDIKKHIADKPEIKKEIINKQKNEKQRIEKPKINKQVIKLPKFDFSSILKNKNALIIIAAVLVVALLGSIALVFLNSDSANKEYYPAKDLVNDATAEYSGSEIANEYEYKTVNGRITISKYKGSESIVRIPYKIDGEVVCFVGNNAFSECTGITKVVIPNSVESIGDYAFYDCKKLKTVVSSESLLTIGESAFESCVSLKEIYLFDSIETIKKYAFYGCSNLEVINIPNSIKEISECTFCNSGLKSITITDNVSVIGEKAFQDCSSLSKVIISDGVSVVSSCAFKNCQSIASISLPESVSIISNEAFYNCTSLQTVEILGNVNAIDKYAFASCSSLKSVVLPDSLKSINEGAFMGCAKLSEINIPIGLSSVQAYAFGGCTNININFPENCYVSKLVFSSK